MPCTPFRSEDGHVTGFVCSRGVRSRRCTVCGSPATILCDWPLQGPKAGQTCDRALCRRCATRVSADADYCPAHATLWREKESSDASR